jgi:hypothetical protein
MSFCSNDNWREHGSLAGERSQKARRMSKVVIIGWSIEAAGMALWLYGYFATGNPSLIDWHANAPWWIADYLPNIESEIGMALIFAGMVPLYGPVRGDKRQ